MEVAERRASEPWRRESPKTYSGVGARAAAAPLGRQGQAAREGDAPADRIRPGHRHRAPPSSIRTVDRPDRGRTGPPAPETRSYGDVGLRPRLARTRDGPAPETCPCPRRACAREGARSSAGAEGRAPHRTPGRPGCTPRRPAGPVTARRPAFTRGRGRSPKGSPVRLPRYGAVSIAGRARWMRHDRELPCPDPPRRPCPGHGAPSPWSQVRCAPPRHGTGCRARAACGPPRRLPSARHPRHAPRRLDAPTSPSVGHRYRPGPCSRSEPCRRSAHGGCGARRRGVADFLRPTPRPAAP